MLKTDNKKNKTNVLGFGFQIHEVHITTLKDNFKNYLLMFVVFYHD